MNQPCHRFITGESQHGKSYWTKWHFIKHTGGGLFFNPKGWSDEVTGAIQCSGGTPLSVIVSAIKKGAKLNFVLSDTLSQARKQLDTVTAAIMAEAQTGCFKSKRIALVYDEVQDFGYQGNIDSGAIRIARTALGLGIDGYFVAQRPADVSKIIVSQCNTKIFFKPSKEDVEWIRSKRYPVDEILKRISGRPHYFCEYLDSFDKLSEAKKL